MLSSRVHNKKKSKSLFFIISLIAIIGVSALLDDKTESSSFTKTTVLPKPLSKKNKIALISTAFFTSDELLRIAKQRVKNIGYQPLEASNAKSKDGYLAGSAKERVAAFHEVLKNNEVGAIFHTRGGFGGVHVLEHLNYDEIKKQRKIIMGYSDVTAMLLAIYTKTGLITYHGPMPKTGLSKIESSYIEQVLVKQKPIKYINPQNKPTKTIVPGIAEGILVGGNLSVICSLLGSEYVPDWRGKILFLEDIGEKIYKVDRMLSQLKIAGVLDGVSGIVLGGFTNMSTLSSYSFSLDEVFRRHFEHLKVPIYSGANFGHISSQFILPVGSKARINADKGIIEIL